MRLRAILQRKRTPISGTRSLNHQLHDSKNDSDLTELNKMKHLQQLKSRIRGRRSSLSTEEVDHSSYVHPDTSSTTSSITTNEVQKGQLGLFELTSRGTSAVTSAAQSYDVDIIAGAISLMARSGCAICFPILFLDVVSIPMATPPRYSLIQEPESRSVHANYSCHSDSFGEINRRYAAWFWSK